MISKLHTAIGYLGGFLFATLLAGAVYAQMPMTFQYVYDSLNQLVRVIDSDGNVLTYTYDEVGNILSIDRTTVGNLPPPTLTSVNPNQVNQDDPITVVLTGTALLGGTVTTTHPGIIIDGFFGDDTQITVNMTVEISASLGPAPLTVTTVSGSDTINVTVVAQRPRITEITPNQGPSIGDTAVTVSGLHFTPDTTLTIGGNPATNVVVVDTTTLTANTPSGPSGQPPVSVDVEVSNINGSDILQNGFNYIFGLNYGDTVSGTIDPAGNEDRYAFNGTVGDVALVQMASSVGGFGATIEIYQPDGSLLCEATRSNFGVIDQVCTLTQGGPHVIVASDADGITAGTYTLTLQRLNGPGNATPIAYGETVAGEIAPVGELDFYTFTGAAGDVALVQMASSVGGFGATIEIYQPDGSLLCEATRSNFGVIDQVCTLTQGGPHVIVASDADGITAGTYTLTLQRLNGPGNATPIAYGETVAGEIAPVGELDFYTFTGAAGDVALVQMASSVGGFGATIEIYQPDGSLLCEATRSNFGVIDQVCTLTQGGPHVIVASDADGITAGTYTLTLQRLNGPGNATPIAYGETVAGEIAPVGELDFYTFTGAAGDVALVQMASSVGGFGATIEIYQPDGSLLCEATRSNFGVIDQVCTLTQGGPHVIVASDADGITAGTYTLTLQRLNGPGNATPIAYGETVAGEIAPVGELDFYTFTGAAGDVALVQMASSVGGFGATIEIYQPDGSLLCEATRSNFGVIDQVCTLTQGGPHVIVASDADGITAGTYTLTLQRLNGPGNATPIAYGETVSDSLDSIAELDTYEFSGSNGDAVEITMTRTLGSLDPQIQTYRPDGSNVSDCSGSTTGSVLVVSCTLNVNGDHTILVSDVNGDETGNYDLTLVGP